MAGGNFFDSDEDDADEDLSSDDDFAFVNSASNMSPTEAYAAMSDEEFEAHIPQINSITLVGRIGQDPQARYFDDGKVVLRLGLAVKRKYHPLERQAPNIKYGEEETDWFNLKLWGRDAEYAEKFVTKGARVGVTGTLNVDAWEDRMTGEERTSVKVIVKHIDILETKAEAEMRRGRSGGGYNQGGLYGNDSGGRGGDDGYGSDNQESGGYGSGGGGGGSFFDD
jgi:single-strand DNA-binding protein